MEGIGRVPNMYNYLVSYCSFVQTFSLALNPFHLFFSSLGLPLFSFALRFFHIWLPFLPSPNKTLFLPQDTLLLFVLVPSTLSSHKPSTSRRHKTSAPSFPVSPFSSSTVEARADQEPSIRVDCDQERLLKTALEDLDLGIAADHPPLQDPTLKKTGREGYIHPSIQTKIDRHLHLPCPGFNHGFIKRFSLQPSQTVLIPSGQHLALRLVVCGTQIQPVRPERFPLSEQRHE